MRQARISWFGTNHVKGNLQCNKAFCAQHDPKRTVKLLIFIYLKVFFQAGLSECILGQVEQFSVTLYTKQRRNSCIDVTVQ